MRVRTLFLIVTLITLTVAMAATPALAQIARTEDGKPDLTGTWSNASVTPLQRAPANKTLVVGEAEAKRIAAGFAVGGIREEGYKDSTYSDPKKGAPPKGGQDFGVQAYDAIWWDPGTTLAFVKGEWRTSYVVEPANGALPFVDPEGQAKRARATGERYATGNAVYDGPEVPTLAERCIVFPPRSGPGILSSGYNNNARFIQTPDHMVIQVEQAHDARIIEIFPTAEKARGSRRPAAMHPWFGDTVGWWEGDTFVAESTNVHPSQAEAHGFPISSQAVITERFTRTSDKDIFYEFSVSDPATYTQTWKAESSFYPAKELYEYACHEGNYSMAGILDGARANERRAVAEARIKAEPGKVEQ
jgi:hypothetical protein